MPRPHHGVGAERTGKNRFAGVKPKNFYHFRKLETLVPTLPMPSRPPSLPREAASAVLETDGSVTAASTVVNEEKSHVKEGNSDSDDDEPLM